MKLAFILGIISMTIAIGDSKEMQRAGEMRDEVNDRYRYCELSPSCDIRHRPLPHLSPDIQAVLYISNIHPCRDVPERSFKKSG